MEQTNPATIIHRLPRCWFPLLIEALNPTTRAVLWSAQVKRPDDYTHLSIPPLSLTFGHRVVVRVQFGNGYVLEAGEPRVV